MSTVPQKHRGYILRASASCDKRRVSDFLLARRTADSSVGYFGGCRIFWKFMETYFNSKSNATNFIGNPNVVAKRKQNRAARHRVNKRGNVETSSPRRRDFLDELKGLV